MPVSFTVAVLSYLLGSIDFAVLVSRWHGIDIYGVGSGNPGASNVLRTLGRRSAALVLVGDAGKGAVAAGSGLLLGDSSLAMAAGFCAVLGHCFPVFHRFRGGKGVATAAGMLAVSFPIPVLILSGGWAALVFATKKASVGSIAAMIGLVPVLAAFGAPPSALAWAGGTAALVLYRHRGNMGRLVRGSEVTIHEG